jgi:ectoine hydroxylase-related dioxygenase (phytanoyl-CoA dioxygenase family)
MKHAPEQWKAQYDRTGYLVVEDCLDKSTLAELRKEIEMITADPDTIRPDLKRHINFERDYVKRKPGQNNLGSDEVGNAVRNIMELPLFSPVFAQFICYEPLLDILQTIFGSPEFTFCNYKCIIKAPKVSSKFHWHRDLPYAEHSTSNVITAMLCLDDMTEANGATVVMPGTHRIPDEQVLDADRDIPEEQLPPDERVTVCCPAGSAVLFHANIIHGGGANRSETPRRNVIGIWAGPDTYPAAAKRLAYQGLMPRSQDPARQRQTQMTFPSLAKSREPAVPV